MTEQNSLYTQLYSLSNYTSNSYLLRVRDSQTGCTGLPNRVYGTPKQGVRDSQTGCTGLPYKVFGSPVLYKTKYKTNQNTNHKTKYKTTTSAPRPVVVRNSLLFLLFVCLKNNCPVETGHALSLHHASCP